MTSMTFLTILDGDTAYQDGGPGGSLVGVPNRFEAGHWAGKQGAVITSISEDLRLTYADTLAVADAKASGEMLVRFRPDAVDGVIRYIASLGEAVGTSIMTGLRVSPTGQVQGVYYTSVNVTMLADLGTVAAGNSYVARLWWDGTEVGAALGSGTPVTTTRGVPSVAFGQANERGLSIGTYNDSQFPLNGLVDAVALFDGRLTDTEYAVYRDATVPWTFDMHNSAPPVINAGADSSAAQTQTWTQNGSFSDADSSGPWTATVDYDDGAGPVPLALNPDKTFTLSYVYVSPGIYEVTVSVTDEGGATGTDTVRVTVSKEPLIGRFIVLSVSGADTNAPTIELP